MSAGGNCATQSRVCGVIGLVHERQREDLGKIAALLMKTLEYRGYDSSGAAIQGTGEDVDLRKDVGAPSVLAEKLGIVDLPGQILCAQVRWATFGAVDRVNAQPHVVRCKTYLYGAHNGNVTNSDELKGWLGGQGHTVLSDNDGEMVVHTVEHYFGQALAALPAGQQRAPEARRGAMQGALVQAGARLKGSYAAVIVDPVARVLYAIKKGSSLYFGVGEADGSHFGIASSDLSSVLKLTRQVVPLSEGEYVEFDARAFRVRSLATGAGLERRVVRSRLRAEDTELKAPFTTFMQQEIHAQVETSRDVIRLFSGGSAAVHALGPALRGLALHERQRLEQALEHLREAQGAEAAGRALAPLAELALQLLPSPGPASFHSSERALLEERARDGLPVGPLALLDVFLEEQEASEWVHAAQAFAERVRRANERGGRVFVLCCGSSFHAAKTGALFMSEIARTDILPLLPGEFRGQYGASVRDGDLVVAVSQSGETKDLIDVINQVISSGRDVGRVALVNNVNSTLAQEKAELVVPLRCGPETAVAATKSFMNQLVVLYCLAIAVGERRNVHEASERRRRLPALPALIQRTLDECGADVRAAARQLYLAPSMHILATRLLGVAKEGALKIREVVLNHAEGFEASEFKHGPNTILGFNTVLGLDQLKGFLAWFGREAAPTLASAPTAEEAARRLERLTADLLEPGAEHTIAGPRVQQAMTADYPLLYVTPPEARDVDLTISQINTHKIRGSSTVVIAEPNAALEAAALKPPMDRPQYRAAYVRLPPTGDALSLAFSATVALQLLALEMSVLKLGHLDALGFVEHGVHPDVPKNVSKSITVD